MGKVKGKHRLDKYYHLAKEHGYRSRAAWKLVQLESKFTFLRSSRSVLDLCAAPGGWMQAAVERVPVGSLIVGVDLDHIRPIRGAIGIQEDITKPQCRAAIKKLMAENGCRAFDLVLHDGSPNVGGAWAQEATSQNALVIDSLKLATEFLAPKGNFVTKVFRSQDYSAVLYCLRQLFEKVEVDKPLASRSASAEIYVLGLKYKAPAKIDPRLLDFKHLFKGGKESPQVVDVLRGTKQKRHREGYEDGVTTLRKVCTATDFVWSESPLDILGSVTSITFEDLACLPIKDHISTTEEVKALCDDLRVLGKQDFKHLLKWRMQIRKALSPTQKATPTTKDVDHENKENEDERMLNEMEELTYALDRKKKRAKKLLAKRRAKDKSRKGTGMQVDALEDGYTDHELFSLSSIKGKKDLVVVDSTEYDDETADVKDSDNEDTHEEDQEYSSDVDSDEERRRYDEQLEDILDQAYEQYVSRKEGSTMQRKRSKQSYSENGQLLEGGNEDDAIHSGQDSDEDHGDLEANPLMVPLDDEVATQEEIARKWFSQDVFTEEDEQVVDPQNYGSEDEMQVEKLEEPLDKLEEPPVPIPNKPNKSEIQVDKPGEQIPISKKTKKNAVQKGRAFKAEDDFEIVPAPATDSSDDSSSDESDESDVETKAEILAYAKKMLRKKQREHMLDDAYNKYMFDDSGLPNWFVDEEKRHRMPIKPVTKEEIAAMKAQFKEIDARPAKKVAQAKARKKRVAMRKLEKVRKKANTISDQADISDRSKMKMIDSLYKKAVPKRPQKEYVVAKKGVQVRAGKGKVLVDRRMKKDVRANKLGKGNSKKGKGSKGQKVKGSAKGSAKGSYKGNKKGKKMNIHD